MASLTELRVLVVGMGGLGCPASLALARSGVKTLGLMDPDVVEISNLHRQILYSGSDLGKPKVEAAAGYFRTRYPYVEIAPLKIAMDSKTLTEYLPYYDLVIDGLDRLEKKFLLNDWCVRYRKPYVHAGVVKFEGQVMAIKPGETACLRCILPKIPSPFVMPTCREAGVLGSASQTIGYSLAQEALNLAEEKGPHRLWKWQFRDRSVRSIVLRRDLNCMACGQGKVEEIRPEVCSDEG